MSIEERGKIEKYIEKKLIGMKDVDKFYIEKKEKDSIGVIVVASKLTPASASAINDVETRVNRDFKILSDFQIYPIEAWQN